jgi:mono/diheme cytochrome c family protein
MMRHSRSTLLGVSLVALCLLTACAPHRVDGRFTEARDAARRGLAYAEQACAACHGVQAGESLSPVPQAPAFETLADTPGMTGLALNVWLHSPHQDMPHLMVDPDHVDDLWAYMASLRRAAGSPGD